MKNTVSIGVIGTGKMGQFHLNVISQIPFINLIGIHDTDKEKCSEAAANYKTKAFQNVQELIDVSDAVIIAAPTQCHFDLTMATLRAGKHVLVEKPMASSIEEAKQIAAYVKKKKLIFQVGHVERFNGAIQEIKKILKAPKIIEARRLAPFTPRINDVGVVLDLMIHDLDIVMSLVDSPIKKYYGVGKCIRTKHEDIASAVLEFENEAIATITASRMTEAKIRTLEISDENSYIFLDYATQDITIHRQAASSSNIDGSEGISYRQESIIERVVIHRDNPLKLEDEYFAKTILGEVPPLRSVDSELMTLTVAQKILEQIHGKK